MRILALVIALAAPLPAFADIPPPDACNRTGDACSTAPPDYKSPGICVKQKCLRATPNGTVEYDCNRCQPKAPAKK
jgi:hypothetical protein